MKPILALLKKNLVSVICGVIVIASVILCYYPTADWYDSPDLDPLTQQPKALLEKLQARKSVAVSIDALLAKKRTLPLVDETGGDPPPLNHFPNDAIISKAKDLFADMKTNCDSLKTDFDALNQHTLLMDGELPDPPTAVRIQFLEDYLGNALDGAKSPAVFILGKILNAGWPLSDSEIAADDDAKKLSLENQVHMIGGKQDPIALKKVQDDWIKEKPAFELDQQLSAATNHGIYVKPSMLNIPLITQNVIPRPYDIWTAQMQLWIEQDIATGILHANSDPGSNQIKNDIQQAPIKQWVSIAFPSPLYVTAGAPVADTAKPPDTPTAAVTGRVCTGLYDTIHVNIQLDIDESKIHQVLASLTDRQLLTITRFDIAPIDGPQMMLQNFVYGNRPCVRVNIELEDMFLRSWIDQYKTAAVKAAIDAGMDPVAG